MPFRLKSFAALCLAIAALALSAGAAFGASPNFPGQIPLPDGWAPEGITAGRGTTVFVGSLASGGILEADVRTGQSRILVNSASGPAVGTEYEQRANRLWVAGGPSGEVRVYDASTGDLLQTYTFSPAGFLNDLVVTRGAVYVTDSFFQQLDVIPLGAAGTLPDPADTQILPLTGDIHFQANQFNANGIVSSRGWLIVCQSVTGQLFRVDPSTGEALDIDLGGANATACDGLEVRGSTLYAVGNVLNRVAVFRLGAGLASAALLGTITSPGLDVPTTVAFQAGRLWLANARFEVPPTPTTPYWLTRLPARP
ncbi:MAG TPA: hypothetical protein VGJ46_09555 [Candidatus Limnocylindrales bacterium]|jgi:outer membrane protein assembly factor BamB